MNAYWISFYMPDMRMTDFELHSPWWVSGYGETETIVVAAVRAPDEDAAWAVIAGAFDSNPEFRERFCEPLDRSPFTDRFPRAAWMAWTDTATCACPEHAVTP